MALPDGYPDESAPEAAWHRALDQLQADAILLVTAAWDASAGVLRDAMADAFRALPDAGAGKLAGLAQAGPASDVCLLLAVLRLTSAEPVRWAALYTPGADPSGAQSCVASAQPAAEAPARLASSELRQPAQELGLAGAWVVQREFAPELSLQAQGAVPMGVSVAALLVALKPSLAESPARPAPAARQDWLLRAAWPPAA